MGSASESKPQRDPNGLRQGGSDGCISGIAPLALRMMNAAATPRPQLRIRRINLDTGRENVAVISRRSTALRPDVFRGFSRVELRQDSKVLLATLLLTR